MKKKIRAIACHAVIPAQAGIHALVLLVDSRLRGNDGEVIRYVRSP